MAFIWNILGSLVFYFPGIKKQNKTKQKTPFLFSIKLSLNHPTLASYIFVNKIEAFIFFSLLDSSKNWNLLLSILIFMAI